jgi:PAS domain S-box-containing protein
MPKRNILVVDDDLEVLKFYRKIFRPETSDDLDILGRKTDARAGLDVACLAYSDPKTLVAEYRRCVEAGEHHPLCIVDMRMPQQNGLVTAEQLREIDPDIDIVISTAAGDFAPQEIRDRLGDRVFFVRKPFDAAEFSLMVQALVDYWVDRQDLRRKTAFFTSLLESMSDLIFMKDVRGIYLTCNATFARFAKRASSEIIGATDRDFLPPELCRDFLQQDMRVMETGRPSTYERQVEHPDGGTCLLETVKSPVYSAAGECIGLIGVGRDITSREKAG